MAAAWPAASSRYLSAADVLAAMPDLDERLALAERTMIALVADAELPPKIAVHPRPDASFVHAMPAHLRGADPSGRDDLVGMKWVAGYPGNGAARTAGDPRGRRPQRRRHRPADRDPRRRPDHRDANGRRVGRGDRAGSRRRSPAGRRGPALIGAGVQGRSHLAGARSDAAGRRAP